MLREGRGALSHVYVRGWGGGAARDVGVGVHVVGAQVCSAGPCTTVTARVGSLELC